MINTQIFVCFDMSLEILKILSKNLALIDTQSVKVWHKDARILYVCFSAVCEKTHNKMKECSISDMSTYQNVYIHHTHNF